jgi:ADP-ribose pyrophosphatase YjhB (NUDIX family)
MLNRFTTVGLHLIWGVTRGHTLGVRGIATDEAGRVMLVRHTYRPGWFLPGGGVERKEHPETACRRELEEESGISPGGLQLLSAHANFQPFFSDHVLVYRVLDWTACAPRADQEIDERGFFALDALPEGVTAGTRRRLDEHFNAAPVTTRW